MEWILLKTDEYINLQETLFSGQIFNFLKTDDFEYTGSIYFFVISFLQKDEQVFYKIIHTKISDDFLISCYIKRFFTLQINYRKELPDLKLTGLRLINNALLPTIFSFICSANNNVKRITKMVNFLYSLGEYACKYKNKDFLYFPSIKKLENIAQKLKNEGFGYRSKYISKTADLLIKDKKFKNLLDFDDVVLEMLSGSNKENFSAINFDLLTNNLLKLSGVGPKVRDCISLMGLGLFEVVPIDTHILKHCKKLFKIEEKQLTTKIYKEIQDRFIKKYGKYAGIYQLFIFKEYLK